jgi:hypothetical protein
MFRRLALTTCLGLFPLLLGPSPAPAGTWDEAERPASPDLVATWFQLWGESVFFDDTWLLRAAPGLGGDGIALNCNGRMARLQVVAERRVTGLGPIDGAPSSFVGELEQGGFSTFAVGAIVETERGRAGIVGLDVRNAETSFLIPYVSVEEAGLAEVTAIIATALQRRVSPPPRGAALAAFR